MHNWRCILQIVCRIDCKCTIKQWIKKCLAFCYPKHTCQTWFLIYFIFHKLFFRLCSLTVSTGSGAFRLASVSASSNRLICPSGYSTVFFSDWRPYRCFYNTATRCFHWAFSVVSCSFTAESESIVCCISCSWISGIAHLGWNIFYLYSTPQKCLRTQYVSSFTDTYFAYLIGIFWEEFCARHGAVPKPILPSASGIAAV